MYLSGFKIANVHQINIIMMVKPQNVFSCIIALHFIPSCLFLCINVCGVLDKLYFCFLRRPSSKTILVMVEPAYNMYIADGIVESGTRDWYKSRTMDLKTWVGCGILPLGRCHVRGVFFIPKILILPVI